MRRARPALTIAASTAPKGTLTSLRRGTGAIEHGVDRAEQTFRRAVVGYEEPSSTRGDWPTSTARRQRGRARRSSAPCSTPGASHTAHRAQTQRRALLALLLKGRRKKVYADRTGLTGADGGPAEPWTPLPAQHAWPSSWPWPKKRASAEPTAPDDIRIWYDRPSVPFHGWAKQLREAGACGRSCATATLCPLRCSIGACTQICRPGATVRK